MTTKYIGQRMKRFEDPPLLMGQGSYVDDKNLPDMLHCYFLRSPIAHARIRSIDASEALAMDGVRRCLPAQTLGISEGCSPSRLRATTWTSPSTPS